MGWSLGGLSSVHRCGSTMAQDGFSRGVMLDAQDKLCYNGSRLRLVSGTYGLSGAEYRTEIESYQLIVQTGNLSTNSVSFEVKSNNGSSTFFGTTSDSRFIAQNLSVPTSWGISLFTDSANNSIKYTYSNQGSGEYLISSIDYTGKGGVGGNKQVVFTYEARVDAQFTDYSESYLAGGLTRQTKRLANVTTYYAGQEVLQYRLNYGNLSATTHRTLLRSVEQCAYNGGYTCLPETTFNWGDTVPQYSQAQPYSPIEHPLTIVEEDFYLTGDLDGDGTSDLMLADISDDESSLKNVMVGKSGSAYSTEFPFAGFNAFSSRYSDLDLNGISEYLAISQQGNFLEATQWDGTTTTESFTTSITNIDNSTISHGIFTRDFNSDGYPDVIVDKVQPNSCVSHTIGQNNLVIVDYCEHDLILYLSDYNNPAPLKFTNQGVIFSYRKNSIDTDTPVYDLGIFEYEFKGMVSNERYDTNWGVYEQAIKNIIDFDGNGVPDIYLELKSTGLIKPQFLMGYQDPVTKNVTYNLIDGSTVGMPSNLLTNDLHRYYKLTDINSDGLSDVVYININNKWAVKINQGGMLGSEIEVSGVNSSIGIGPNGTQVWPTISHDWDGDGRNDILIADISDPTKRLEEFCIWKYDTLVDTNEEVVCGEEFYSTSGLQNWGGSDRSLYKWDVLKWESDGAGGYKITKQPTTIEAISNISQSGDKNGDGLSSLFDRRGYIPKQDKDPVRGWRTLGMNPVGGSGTLPVVYRTENISDLPDTVKLHPKVIHFTP